MKRKRVMIVDDSAVVRLVIGAALSASSEFEVEVASDPVFAMAKMEREWPDVIVLDVEMPRMDGITFLKKIMSERPTPVVICSTLAARGAPVALQALAAGAVDLIEKPKSSMGDYFKQHAHDLVNVISHAARVRVRPGAVRKSGPITPRPAVSAATSAHQRKPALVAIGASTGGTQALEAVLTALPRDCPPIMVVQHMPVKFTAAFAERLNAICEIEVKEAEHGDRVQPGRALIAEGGRHMSVARRGAELIAEVIDGPLVNRHRPSVDVLFRSVARVAGRSALGVIMTGMGNDGAHGLKEMRDCGALTIAQDEASCVVYGMPKEAVKLGAVEYSATLHDIPGEILSPRWMTHEV